MLPMSLQKALLVGYLYDDAFSDFRAFFRPDLYYDSDLLQRITYGLRPRFFKSVGAGAGQDPEGVIYKEGDEVHEMYLI